MYRVLFSTTGTRVIHGNTQAGSTILILTYLKILHYLGVVYNE